MEGGSAPTLANTSNDYQVFLLVTRDEGVRHGMERKL